MKEVLNRRFKRAIQEKGNYLSFPDLVLIDGGKVIVSGKHEELLKSSELYKNFYQNNRPFGDLVNIHDLDNILLKKDSHTRERILLALYTFPLILLNHQDGMAR